VRGEIVRDGAAVRFRSARLEITLPERFNAVKPGMTTLGIRPEHLALADLDADFRFHVLVVEPLGAETLVHGRTPAGEDVSIRFAGTGDVLPETIVGARIDRARLFWFDPATGSALACTEGTA